MKIKKGLMILVSCFGAAVFAAFGCGNYDHNGSSGNDTWDGSSDGVATFHLEGGAGNSSIDADGVLKDAEDGIIASGDGESNTFSIQDGVHVGCQFRINSTSQTTSGIDVVTDSANCASPNKCIVCEPNSSTTSGDCNISCDGIVPSNVETAEDSFPVILEIIADINSNMPAPDGMIVSGGEITNWPEFDPASTTSGILYDLSGCSGDDGTNTKMDADILSQFAVASQWSADFNIFSVGDGNCKIVETMTAMMPLDGALEGTIDLVRGYVDAGFGIYDFAN